jgi:hypothetical protein
VDECQGPDEEVEHVGAPPEGVRQPLAVAVRDREREQELRSDDPERGPHGAIGSRAGDEQICEPEAEVVVGEKREDV